MKKWLKPEEHSPPGEAGNYGWVHPKTGLYYNGVWGGHAKAAHELGFRGDTDTEINDNAVDAGYTRWYVAPDEIGVHFNKDCPDAPKRAKETLAYHAQSQRGRMLLADTGTDYYHGTSLKDAHAFIDRVSTKMRGRKETDYMRMKRELGESRIDQLIRDTLSESVQLVRDQSITGADRARYNVHHNGENIGMLAVSKVRSAPGLPAGAVGGKLGVKISPQHRGNPKLVMSAMRQLKQLHPDLTHVGGFRLTGTRSDADAGDSYTWVKLREDANANALISAKIKVLRDEGCK